MLTLASIITLFIAVWKIPAVNRLVLSRAEKLPDWAQPIPPAVLSVLAMAGEGYLHGLRDEPLISYAFSGQTAEVAFIAVGIWHVGKRWAPKLRWTKKAAPLILLAFLPRCGTPAPKLPSADQAIVTAVNLTDQAVTTYIILTPDTASDVPLEELVGRLNTAVSLLAHTKQYCDALQELQAAAKGVSCSQCLTAITTAKETLQCPL